MKEEVEMGFFLIDARNAFIEGNRTNMLWTVWHLWPTGARFTFNCYRHHLMLYLKSADGCEFEIIHSREEVTQGDPFPMIAYVILLLPMIQILRKEFPDIFQPWYADDGAGMAPIPRLFLLYNHLRAIGSKYRYYPDASKSILIVEHKGVARATKLIESFSFKVTTGLGYLGIFISERGAQIEWTRSQVENWEEGATQIATLTATHLMV